MGVVGNSKWVLPAIVACLVSVFVLAASGQPVNPDSTTTPPAPGDEEDCGQVTLVYTVDTIPLPPEPSISAPHTRLCNYTTQLFRCQEGQPVPPSLMNMIPLGRTMQEGSRIDACDSHGIPHPDYAVHHMFAEGMDTLNRAPVNKCAGLYFHTGITFVKEEDGSDRYIDSGARKCDWSLLMTVGTNGGCGDGGLEEGRRVLMTGIGSGRSECLAPMRKDFIITLIEKGEDYPIFQ